MPPPAQSFGCTSAVTTANPLYEGLVKGYLSLEHRYNIVANERDNLVESFRAGLLEPLPETHHDLQAIKQHITATEQARDAALAQQASLELQFTQEIFSLRQQATKEISELRETIQEFSRREQKAAQALSGLQQVAAKQADELCKAAQLNRQIRHCMAEIRKLRVDNSSLARELKECTAQRDEAYNMLPGSAVKDIGIINPTIGLSHWETLPYQLEQAQGKNQQPDSLVKELQSENLQLAAQSVSLQRDIQVMAMRSRRRTSKLRSSHLNQLRKWKSREKKARMNLEADFKASVAAQAKSYIEAREEVIEKKYRKKYGKMLTIAEKEMCERMLKHAACYRSEKECSPLTSASARAAKDADIAACRKHECVALKTAGDMLAAVHTEHQHVYYSATRVFHQSVLEEDLLSLRVAWKRRRFQERAMKNKERNQTITTTA
ncbi:hypothetical protein GGS23DRAFT_598961 [Durotheca rogersii]|uniref:uncharacterized protein n=1 Tax=Durotheca rogersii TaxID=419775 RepID=UPI00221F9A62|nr:uncharacterized protein GGS23DRAFT_598961 [Durotheca rogersii]KAI5861084.1 hypothetical protein GGS23DRAFT_598961 [Durotheca rogersii]